MAGLSFGLRKAGAIFGFAAVLLTASCTTTSTPYQPDAAGQRIHGGYSEVRLDENHFQVTFDGNTFTSRDRVEDYLLYRAAELTVQTGYAWFRIVDRQTDRNQRTYSEPSYRPGYVYGYWRPYWRYRPYRGSWATWYPYGNDPFWADRMDVRTVVEYEAHAEIIMGRGPLPTDNGNVFDARQVMAVLGPTIEWPKP